ncbi:MAG: hypothetical protein J5606_02695 [Bacteroidales bacterium]|nr:hypothetical protein [Bacteroidales bacterium]
MKKAMGSMPFIVAVAGLLLCTACKKKEIYKFDNREAILFVGFFPV